MRSIEVLVKELRFAHEEVVRRKIAMEDGKLTLSNLRKQYAKAVKAKEAIDLELITGKGAAPLLDAIESSNGRAEPKHDTADEHQRGPTVREPRIADHKVVPPTPRKRGRPPKVQAAERVETAKGVDGHKPGCKFEAVLGAAAQAELSEKPDPWDEPMLTYRVSKRTGLGSEVLGRVVAVDPGRAVRAAKDRWGTREEYLVREMTTEELAEDLKVRPKEPYAPIAYEIIDTMAAAKAQAEPDQADDDPPAALEWTSADLERELIAACGRTHPGTVWGAAREDGCDDAKILEILRAIWPGGYRVERGTGPWKSGPGCTIHGGPTPAFWVGCRKSTDWKLAPPQLQGLQLADRVRNVLGIPRARVQPEPETAADRQPVRKRRGKEAASAL